MTDDKNNFLAIVNQMIGTMKIEPSKINHIGPQAPKGTQVDTFNEMMDAAIAKAHQVVAEANRYDEPEKERLRKLLDDCVEFNRENILKRMQKAEDKVNACKPGTEEFHQAWQELLAIQSECERLNKYH